MLTNLAIAPASTPANNLITNPSFEVDLSGWANTDGGAWGSMTSGATLTRVTTQHESGVASMQISGTFNYEMGACYLLSGTFVSGLPYTFSAYLLGNAGGEPVNLRIGLASDATQVTNTLTTSWVRYSATWTPAANRSGVYAYIVTQTPSAITWFADATQVTQSSGVVPYSEGGSTEVAMGLAGQAISRASLT